MPVLVPLGVKMTLGPTECPYEALCFCSNRSQPLAALGAMGESVVEFGATVTVSTAGMTKLARRPCQVSVLSGSPSVLLLPRLLHPLAHFTSRGQRRAAEGANSGVPPFPPSSRTISSRTFLIAGLRSSALRLRFVLHPSAKAPTRKCSLQLIRGQFLTVVIRRTTASPGLPPACPVAPFRLLNASPPTTTLLTNRLAATSVASTFRPTTTSALHRVPVGVLTPSRPLSTAMASSLAPRVLRAVPSTCICKPRHSLHGSRARKRASFTRWALRPTRRTFPPSRARDASSFRTRTTTRRSAWGHG